MHVVLLNGPPRSGKDTIGGMLDIPSRKFAFPILMFLEDAFGICIDDCEKDAPHENLFGRTPREVAIAFSEKFCKPLFGMDYFGRSALQHCKNMQELRCQLAVFTDSGFSQEAAVLAEHFPCLQVRLFREGRTFLGDSRSYWEHPKIGHIDFYNNFPDLASLQEAVRTDLAPEIRKWASL